MLQTKRTTVAHIYNPANQSEQELIANFVVRKKKFQAVFEDIKTAPMQFPEQDYIIQGPRGSGKTTLLLRLYYEIKNDKELNKRLIPVIFSEEQYFIRSLDRLWEAVIEEINKTNPEKVCEPSQHYLDEEEHYFQILTIILQQQHKKVILLIDNIGDMLDKFNDLEQHRLRERLITSADIRIIGASSKILEHTYDYSKPFFEFFKFVYLKGLTAEETDQLLLRLSQTYNESTVADIVKNQRGRVETLRRLTGGIPRTIILLFEIFAEEHNDDSFRDLEAVLDRVTPLYKHRMDDLSPMQQELVDAIALNWDAMTFEEITAKVRMDNETVQDQLEKLVKNRIVDIIPTPAKVLLYQIAERFFNIWYLMRCGRRGDKNRVIWLVRFLQDWCSQEELIDRVRRFMKTLGKGGYYPRQAFYMAEALAQTGLPYEIQQGLLEKTRTFLEEKDRGLLQELSKSDKELGEEAIKYYAKKEFGLALRSLEAIQYKTAPIYGTMGELCYELKDYVNAETYYLQAIVYGDVDAMYNLAVLYETVHKDYVKAESFYQRAVALGDVGSMNNLARLYETVHQDYAKAETYYLKAISQGHVEALYNLALLYKNEYQDYVKAETYYLQAVAHGDTDAMNNLALLYETVHQDYSKAETYYQQAVTQENTDAMYNLANLYRGIHQDYAKAETYYLQAIAQGHVASMYNLAMLYETIYQDYAKAETYYLQAIESMLNTDSFDRYNKAVGHVLLFFLVRGKYDYVAHLFQNSRFDLQDRYKPVYYALIYFMQEEYPAEYFRMGEELQETVEEIIEEIKQLQEKYA